MKIISIYFSTHELTAYNNHHCQWLLATIFRKQNQCNHIVYGQAQATSIEAVAVTRPNARWLLGTKAAFLVQKWYFQIFSITEYIW
jgi:hypothetical protein